MQRTTTTTHPHPLPAQIDALLQKYDTDADGGISYSEFAAGMQPHADAAPAALENDLYGPRAGSELPAI